MRLAGGFERVTWEHVPRERNRRADALANQAMDERQSSRPLPKEVAELLSASAQESLFFGEGR